MFRRSPFKDAEVNPEPPERDFIDFLGFVGNFFYFYRRLWLGIVILAGLGYWINYVVVTPDDLGEPSVVPVNNVTSKPVEPEKRTSSMELIILGNGKVDDEVESQADESGVIFLPDVKRKSTADAERPEPANRVDSLEQAAVDDSLLENGTVDELIAESLELQETWGEASLGKGLVMCSRQAKITRRLLEMELTELQRRYAITSYIESISLVHCLNVAGEMDLSGTRSELLEVDQKYSNHADPAVAGKANLTMIMVLIKEFVNTRELSKLGAAQVAFDARFESIVNDLPSITKMVDITVRLVQESGEEFNTKPFALHVLSRLEKEKNEKTEKLVVKLSESIDFVGIDLSLLVQQAEIDDEEARKTIHSFFEALAANPNSHITKYQTAFDVIGKYKEAGKEEEVERLLKWVEEVAAEVTRDEKRNGILDAAKKFRPM